LLSLCLIKHYTTKTYEEVAVYIHALLTSELDRWRKVVSFTPQSLYSRGKSPRYPSDGNLELSP